MRGGSRERRESVRTLRSTTARKEPSGVNETSQALGWRTYATLRDVRLHNVMRT